MRLRLLKCCLCFTRMDATLRELTGLIKEVNIESRVRGTTFDFVLVSPEYNSPRFTSFEIGTTIAGNRSPDDSKTLGNTRYVWLLNLGLATCDFMWPVSKIYNLFTNKHYIKTK